MQPVARGHIRKRGDAWELRVSAGSDPITGQRRVVTRTFRGRKDDAERALTKLLGELDAGAHRGPDTELRVLLDRWWGHASTRWAPATKRTYANYRRYYLDDHSERPISKITPEWLDQLYARLLARPLAPSTVYKVHVMLHDALDDAVRWGWLVWNPADRAEPPSIKRRPVKVPERSALADAVAAVAKDDPDFAALLHLQAVAGLRRAELLGLRWDDLADGLLWIRRTVVLDEAGRVLVQDDTKSHRARRLALDPRTLEVIEDHRLRAKNRAAALEVEVDRAYLFPRSEGDPFTAMNPDALTLRWRRKRDDLGLAGVKLHAFRHAMCTYLLDQGVPVHDVAARAGHANANVTLAIYTHPTTEGARRAGDAAGL